MNKRFFIELHGVARALLLSLVLCIAAALVIYYSNLQETLLVPLSRIILVLSIFWGGCYASRQYGSKGLIRGMTVGLIFFVIMAIASAIVNISSITVGALLYSLGICLAAGALGGIMGIGLSS
ncbi:MAG: TIGR04086 family membrane protein [Syntrophomonadaceae bacterium]|jgi:putative membrane protein (TIGR04086 family)